MALPFFHPYRGSIGRFFQGDKTLRGYWQLDGSSIDNSGNGNNGMDTAVSYSPAYGRFNGGQGGLYSTASGSKSVISSSLGIDGTNAPLTLEAWVNLKSLPSSSSEYAIVFQGSSVNQVSYTLAVANNYYSTIGLLFWANRNAVSQSYAGYNTTLSTGIWYHLVGTFDGSTIKLYFNGNLVASTASSGNGSSGLSSETAISDRVGNDHADAYIDEVAVFSRALSPQEISQYYQWATSFKKQSWYGSIIQAVQSGAAFLYEFLSSN
jgi:hypothetical protein